MGTYILKRLLLMIPTLFGILVVSFIVIHLAPGDPAALKYGGVGQATAGLNADRGTESAEKMFRAALEVGLAQRAFAVMAGLVQRGWVRRPESWAGPGSRNVSATEPCVTSWATAS